ncbi:hypothetical protein DESC_190002 [Desulfosarcina cetonica]|nr:hypothetical protein DESC_190002 [Desulfosarcina cetonica]
MFDNLNFSVKSPTTKYGIGDVGIEIKTLSSTYRFADREHKLQPCRVSVGWKQSIGKLIKCKAKPRIHM